MRKKTIIYKIIGSSAKCLVFIGKKLVSTICLLTGTAQFTIYGVLLKDTDFIISGHRRRILQQITIIIQVSKMAQTTYKVYSDP